MSDAHEADNKPPTANATLYPHAGPLLDWHAGVSQNARDALTLRDFLALHDVVERQVEARGHARVYSVRIEISKALEAIRSCSSTLDVNAPAGDWTGTAEHMRSRMVRIDGLLDEIFKDDSDHLSGAYGDGLDAILAGLKRILELKAIHSRVTEELEEQRG